MQIKTLMLPLTIMIPTACTTFDPVHVEQDFGNSVRQMVQNQIYDQEAAFNPGTEPSLSTDGVMLQEAIKAYRDDVTRPEAETPPLLVVPLGN